MIAAVILPRRETLRQALTEAIATRHDAAARLYTDGERLAWLPRPLRGWVRFAACEKGAA